MKTSEILAREQKVYAGVFKRLPLALERGKGPFVWDTEGKKYLDFFGGIAVNCLGHAHPRILKAIADQSKKLMHTSNWVYTLPQIELAEKLVKITGQERAFITNDGSEAVECAIKLALASTGKKDFVALKGGFHGRTLGALSLTSGGKYRNPFKAFLGKVTFVDFGDSEAVEDAIRKDTAAVVIEPIQGEAGVILPPEGYLKRLRDITEDKRVPLIVDEVQTGFGRTGKMFGFQHENIKPDIICLSKALGGGFPIGATLYSGRDFSRGEHGGTFVGNPLACAVAKEVIAVIEEDKLVENARVMGDYLMEQVKKLGFSVHGRGLMVGIDVKDGEKTVLDLISHGVLAIYSGNIVRALPQLNIEKKHINLFVEALAKVKK